VARKNRADDSTRRLASRLLSVSTVRPLFLAWLTLALLLFGLGRLSRAGDELAIAGFVTASEQEASEGYFTVGGDTMVVVKQGSDMQRWLKMHSGQRVTVTLESAAREN
jgi:hypothetical protein